MRLLNTIVAASVLTVFALTAAASENCFRLTFRWCCMEFNKTTVCQTSGGVVSCPGELIQSDPYYRYDEPGTGWYQTVYVGLGDTKYCRWHPAFCDTLSCFPGCCAINYDEQAIQERVCQDHIYPDNPPNFECGWGE